MNAQYSRIGRTYPKMDSNEMGIVSTSQNTSFSSTEDGKTIQLVIESKLNRLKTNNKNKQ